MQKQEAIQYGKQCKNRKQYNTGNNAKTGSNTIRETMQILEAIHYGKQCKHCKQYITGKHSQKNTIQLEIQYKYGKQFVRETYNTENYTIQESTQIWKQYKYTKLYKYVNQYNLASKSVTKIFEYLQKACVQKQGSWFVRNVDRRW